MWEGGRWKRKYKGGRPKRRWLDRVRGDVKEKGLSEGGSVRPSYMETYVVKHRRHIKVGLEESRVLSFYCFAISLKAMR